MLQWMLHCNFSFILKSRTILLSSLDYLIQFHRLGNTTSKMPRGKAFSGKQKKLQLKAKKQRKQGETEDHDDDGQQAVLLTNKPSSSQAPFGVMPAKLVETGRNRYALKFRSETEESIKLSKKLATKVITPVSPEYLECQIEDFFTPELDFPIRPTWDYSLSKEQLDSQERKYFNEYLKKIESAFEASMSELSYFELNLETWRQFWRVLEMSDVLLCIVDIRFPALLFPPKLYEFACDKLGKDVILVLNKIDLAPAPLVLAWKEYFKTKFPKLQTICFTSYPAYNLHGNTESSMKGRRKKGKLKMAAEGAKILLKVCENLVGTQVDLSSWRSKIEAELSVEDNDEEAEQEIGTMDNTVPDIGHYEYKKYVGGTLTLGCVGQPNVGKSSVINALMGKKVVSVSKTPGHTKHFQTIFLTQNVRLCDCPGLVFPSRVPKPLQVLCGSFPVAQLRDPVSILRYLCERLNLPKILSITQADSQWSAHDVAEGWAVKRGYFTAKGARPDVSRAANHILRLALEGRVCLCLLPPNYGKEKEKWSQHPEVKEIELIQAKSETKEDKDNSAEDESGTDEESEELSSNEDTSKPTENKVARSRQPQAGNKFAILNIEDDESEDEGDTNDSEDED